MKTKWQHIDDETTRMPVPGGWLYRTDRWSTFVPKARVHWSEEPEPLTPREEVAAILAEMRRREVLAMTPEELTAALTETGAKLKKEEQA